MSAVTETAMNDATTRAPASQKGLSARQHWVHISALVAVTLAAYANSLLNSFTYDDFLYILNNPGVTHPSLRAFFTATRLSNVFRPVTFATFSFNWILGNIHAFGYHLFNLLLHVAVTVLLYVLLKKLLENVPQAETISFVAALLFAVHPIHTEAVASIVGRSELLAAFFLLAAWLFHLEDRRLPALFCFLLALMSKESAVSFVPVVLFGDYLRGKFKPRLVYLWIIFVAVGYAGALWIAQGGTFGEHGVAALDNPLANFPPRFRILNALRVAWKYLALLVFPASLSYDYSYNAILLYSDWRHTLPALLATVAVVALWMWAVITRKTSWAFAGVIYLGCFAITSNILIPTGTIMGERLAYLPSAGFCLLVALLWIQLQKRASALAWGFLLVILGAFSARTVVRNGDWRSNFTLFSAASRVVPEDARMHANLGGFYMDSGQLEKARVELQTALRIYPSFPDALEFYGLTEARLGHDEQALPLLQKAVFQTRTDSVMYVDRTVNLSAMLIKMGKYQDARALLDLAITKEPQNARAWSNRAVVRYRIGERAGARNDAETALRLAPNNPQAKSLLSAMDAAPDIPTR
jgi:Flp pilus assembly protein TadD